MLGLSRFIANFLKVLTHPIKAQNKDNHSKRSQSKENNYASAKYQLYTGEKVNWWQLIIRLEKSIFPVILPSVLFYFTYGLLISLLYSLGLPVAFPADSDVITKAVLSFNIGLTLLLVFRTNTAHERFWEGRKLWGMLVNATRNLTRDIWIVVKEKEPQDRAEKEATLRLVVAFAFAMKLHLRGEGVNEKLAPLMSEIQYFRLKDINHPPLQIAFWIGDYLQYQYDRDRLNAYQLAALHKLVDELVDILGGCERILKTPLPLIYPIILRKLVLMYCLVLPLEIVPDVRWLTGVVTAFVSFTLLSIEQIGAEIEEPFGHDPNDLPLPRICQTIRHNVEELISLAPSNSRSANIKF